VLSGRKPQTDDRDTNRDIRQLRGAQVESFTLNSIKPSKVQTSPAKALKLVDAKN